MAPRKITHVVVRSRSARARRFLAVAAAIGILAGGWLLFELGRGLGGYSVVASLAKEASLRARVHGLETENDRLRAQMTAFQQAGEIDRRAYEQVDRNLADLQDEMLELRQEVTFYRGIVHSEDSAAGLRIQSFKVRQEDGGRYQYRLVLTQLATTKAESQGNAEMVMSGVRYGEPVELSGRELADDKDRAELRFSLRHFQELKGVLILPDGFTPLRVTWRATPRGGGTTIERTFNWSDSAS